MTDRWRALARIALFVAAVGAIVGIAGVGIWAALGRGAAGPATPAQPVRLQPAKSLTRLLLGIYLSFHQSDISQPLDPANKVQVDFTVAPGETAATIGPRLESMGLIRDAALFTSVVRYRGVDGALEVGEYKLSPSMSLEQIVIELQHGRAKTVRVTIPEGWRMEQIAAKLSAAGLGSVDEYLALMRKSDYPYPWLKNRPEGAPDSLEGFLFPDTYQFPVDATPAAVVDLMLRNFDSRITPELRKGLAAHGLTFYEAIVLGSIVEREAVVAQERPLIAGVFLLRLDRGMSLQADPTVSYAKGYDAEAKRWWTPMLEEDPKEVDSLYNTFLYAGLTPGPICSPGLSSIDAVAHAAQTKYLFFVSKGDGSHAFAETYDEHLQNMSKYRR